MDPDDIQAELVSRLAFELLKMVAVRATARLPLWPVRRDPTDCRKPAGHNAIAGDLGSLEPE